MSFAEHHAQHGIAISLGLFAEAECDTLVALPTLQARTGRAGVRHLMRVPELAACASDPRLLSLATAALGTHAIPFRATFFDKSPSSNWLVPWHQDTALPLKERVEKPGWGPWSTKEGVLCAHAPASALARVVALRLHLDHSTAVNGPLRVLPGSHRLGVLSDEDVAAYARHHAAREMACLVPKGGVLAMSPLLIHSSAKVISDQPRRVLHLGYASSLDIARGLRLAIA